MTTFLDMPATAPRKAAARRDRRTKGVAWLAFLLAYLLVAGLVLIPADPMVETGVEAPQIAVIAP